jgi:hypothetical protein
MHFLAQHVSRFSGQAQKPLRHGYLPVRRVAREGVHDGIE